MKINDPDLIQIRLTVNGQVRETGIRPTDRLLDVLRNQLGLTAAKEGCGEGECGACTVIMDGEAVNACMVMAFQARGKTITTAEGLADGQHLNRLQQAFVDKGGIQCGFCTPGMLMSATALLNKTPDPDSQEIRTAIAGNLCRCTGYTQIFDSIKAASQAAGTGPGPEAQTQHPVPKEAGNEIL